MVLPDVLAPGLRVVFCGTAAGEASARRGAYYAGPGNQFWATLQEIGLTPRLLSPTQFASLPDFGAGLTDVSKTEFGADNALTSNAFDVAGLIARLEAVRPAIVAFNGKKAAEIVLGHKVEYGVQSERLAGAQVHVLPSTSGAARGFWDVGHWRALGDAVRALGTPT